MKKTFTLLLLAMFVAAGAQAETIDLAAQPAKVKTITLKNGDVLTGKMDHDIAIKIDESAMVTFHNVDINGSRNLGASSSHAGVACHGSATITLKGNNYISGSKGDKPAIFIPKGKTLVIRESLDGGYLRAQSGWDPKNGEIAPAIGAKRIAIPYYPGISYNPDCGNITIVSGHIVAIAGDRSAAIGSGYGSTCGNIRIDGGKVEAVSEYGAAIGSGCSYQASIGKVYDSKCGNITIVGGDVFGYSYYSSAIGGGCMGNCGDITITDGVTSIYAATNKGEHCIGKGTKNRHLPWFSGGFDTKVGVISVMGQFFFDAVSPSPYIYPVGLNPSTELPIDELCTSLPTNVTVSNISDYSATVSWETNVQKFEPYSCDILYYYPVDDEKTIFTRSTYDKSYELTGLEANKTYGLYIVHKCNDYERSGHSDTVIFSTKPKQVLVPTTEIYTEFKDGTLTYYYDDKKNTRTGIVEDYNPEDPGLRFQDYAEQVTEAKLDPSMRNAALTSTKRMFYGGDNHGRLYNLTHITGLEYLEMFFVTTTSSMFEGLHALEELDMTSWYMYSVEDLSHMFRSCESLIELNLGSWELWSASNVQSMFHHCRNLCLIYCNKDFSNSTLNITSTNMFYNCHKLIGGMGTTYNSSNVTHEYARPDGGSDNPGYFTAYTCDAPYKITATNITSNSARITWDPGSPFQYAWNVIYKKAGEPSTSIHVQQPRVVLYDLEPNTTYTVAIEGECAKTMIGMMSQIDFTTSAPEGIEQVMSNDELNDARKIIIDGMLYIRVNDHLYDAQGKQVK